MVNENKNTNINNNNNKLLLLTLILIIITINRIISLSDLTTIYVQIPFFMRKENLRIRSKEEKP